MKTSRYVKRLRDLKKELKYTEDLLYEKDTQKWRIERKLNLALYRLKSIAAGFTPSTYNKEWEYSNKLQLSAADTLEEISKL